MGGTFKMPTKNGPISKSSEYRQYRVHYLRPFRPYKYVKQQHLGLLFKSFGLFFLGMSQESFRADRGRLGSRCRIVWAIGPSSKGLPLANLPNVCFWKRLSNKKAWNVGRLFRIVRSLTMQSRSRRARTTSQATSIRQP